MTREQLEGYKSKKEEIAELEYKLKHLSEDSTDNDIIMDYRKGYPQPQAIVGVDMNKYNNARARYTARIEKLRAECDEIEEFVENIEDSVTRRIFRMYYIDGISQDNVAKAVHMSQSLVSKKISDFLKLEYK